MMSTPAERTAHNVAGAPPPIGAYSHAVAWGDLLFCSGALPVDPETGELIDGSQGEQVAQCLRNLVAVCHSAGTSLTNALRVTIYTTRLENFPEIDRAYAGFFESAPPARVTVGVAALPKQADIEVDAVVGLDRRSDS